MRSQLKVVFAFVALCNASIASAQDLTPVLREANSAAPADVILAVYPSTLATSTSVDVPLYLLNIGAQPSTIFLSIDYDPADLDLTDIQLSAAATAASKTLQFNELLPGFVTVTIGGLNQNSIPEGLLLTLSFDLVDFEVDTTVSPLNISAAAADASVLSVDGLGGTVTGSGPPAALPAGRVWAAGALCLLIVLGAVIAFRRRRAFAIIVVIVGTTSPVYGIGVAGDLDNSGTVDSADMQLVFEEYLEGRRGLSKDVDLSGAVDATDAQLVINAALGVDLDADNDGLFDIIEPALGADPTLLDTDGDGIDDGQEVINGTDPNGPLSVTLVADPPIGPPPQIVVLETNLPSSAESTLTYSWDFGDGDTDGSGNSEVHTFDSEGVYAVEVTVSDGTNSATAQTTVTVTSSLPASTMTIGGNGGTVSQGTMSLTVPSDLLPAETDLTLTELPTSSKSAAAKAIDPAFGVPFGPMYRFDTLARSPEPITARITYNDADVPNGFDEANIAVLDRTIVYGEGTQEGLAAPGFRASYDPIPAIVDPLTNVVEFEVYQFGTFQLVALAEPLDVVSQSAQKAADDLNFKFVIIDDPAETWYGSPRAEELRARFLQTIENALLHSHDVFVKQRGFPPPAVPVMVYIKDLTTCHTKNGKKKCEWNLGEVPYCKPGSLYLSYNKLLGFIATTTGHEYFHVLQMSSANCASLTTFWKEDRYFVEGTAAWAQDEAFDNFQGKPNTHAPTHKRFEHPLNRVYTDKDSQDLLYETMAYWKWVHSQDSSAIKNVLVNQQATTMASSPPGKAKIQLTTANRWETTFANDFGGFDFLTFCVDALLYHNFETDETRTEDLWDENRLGPPESSPANTLSNGLPNGPQKTRAISKDGPGDGLSRALNIPFALTQGLTADVATVETAEALKPGKLKLKFSADPAGSQPEVSLVAVKSDKVVETKTVTLSGSTDTTAEIGFESGSKVTIIIADTRSTPNLSNIYFGLYQVWYEEDKCPPLTITATVNPSTFISTLDAVPPGSVLKLEPGTYNLPRRQTWPAFFYYFTADLYRGTNLALNNITLVGSGKGSTVLVLDLTQPPWISGGFAAIVALGNSGLRDMTVRILHTGSEIGTGISYGIQLPTMESIVDFTMCNVDYSGPRGIHLFNDSILGDYIYSGTHQVTIVDSTIDHDPTLWTPPNPGNGIYLSDGDWYDPGNDAETYRVELVGNTTLRGWDGGLVVNHESLENFDLQYSCGQFSNCSGPNFASVEEIDRITNTRTVKCP